MDAKALLCFMCSFAGLVMIIGGIWLIYKEKIYIDKETNQVTELETPIGKFKTNVPALVLFALGFIPLIYPIYKVSELLPEIKIDGEVHSTTFPVQIYAVIKTESVLGPDKFHFSVPRVGDLGSYKILYVAPGIITQDVPEFDNSGSVVHLAIKDIKAAVKLEGKLEAKPEGY